MKEKPEIELLLQAYVDGQLGTVEAGRVEKMIQEDPAVLVSVEDLKRLSKVCSLADRTITVPMPRGPYWNQIRSRLEDLSVPVREPSTQRVASWRDVLLKFAIPSAAVIALGVAMFFQDPVATPNSKDFVVLSIDHEIETMSEEASYMTFRSEQEGLTVVWLDTSIDY